MLKEFKEFALQGNVIDLAIGVIIGAAFSDIVGGLTEGIFNPIIGFLTAGVDLKAMSVLIGDVELNYGLFIDSLIKFIIIAFFLFLIVKSLNKLKKEEEQITSKACPYCYEEISLEAVKCPHCTADLAQ